MSNGDQPASKLPDLGKYLEKRVVVRLLGNRKVSGELRGYDHFMNVVLHGAAEEHYNGTNTPLAEAVIRGNTIVNIELVAAPAS
jgi:small nuclear ribonucleoprotein G